MAVNVRDLSAFEVIYGRDHHRPFSRDKEGHTLRSESAISQYVFRETPMYAHLSRTCPRSVSVTGMLPTTGYVSPPKTPLKPFQPPSLEPLMPAPKHTMGGDYRCVPDGSVSAALGGSTAPRRTSSSRPHHRMDGGTDIAAPKEAAYKPAATKRPRTPFFDDSHLFADPSFDGSLGRKLGSLTSKEFRALAPGCRARAMGGLGNMFMKNNVPGSTVLGTVLPVRAGYQFPRTIGPRERMMGFDNPSRKL